MSRPAVLLALLAVALLAGCGEGGETTAPAPTQAQAEATAADPAYATKADAICRRALAETHQLGQRFSQSASAGESLLDSTTALLVAPGIEIRKQMADRLRALPPPEEGAEAVAAYVELFDPLEALSYERLRAGRAGDLEEASRFEGLMLELAREQTAAARLAGLDACAADFVKAAFG